MPEFHPDTITATPERITAAYGTAADGGVSVHLIAECPPPLGTIRLVLAPGQPGLLHAALSQFISLTDEQYDQLAELVRINNESEGTDQ